MEVMVINNNHNNISENFDPPLDIGIQDTVIILRNAGIETYESCEGGQGHSYPQPSVRFHGDRSEGFRALAVALQSGLGISELKRVWSIIDGEPSGPYWELTFGLKKLKEKDGNNGNSDK